MKLVCRVSESLLREVKADVRGVRVSHREKTAPDAWFRRLAMPLKVMEE